MPSKTGPARRAARVTLCLAVLLAAGCAHTDAEVPIEPLVPAAGRGGPRARAGAGGGAARVPPGGAGLRGAGCADAAAGAPSEPRAPAAGRVGPGLGPGTRAFSSG